jgi:hypothetical protein
MTVCTQPSTMHAIYATVYPSHNSMCTIYVTVCTKYSATCQQNAPADYCMISGSNNMFIHGLQHFQNQNYKSLQNQLCNFPVAFSSNWHSLRCCSYPHCSRQVLTTRFTKLSFHFWWNSDFIHISYLFIFRCFSSYLCVASSFHFEQSPDQVSRLLNETLCPLFS